MSQSSICRLCHHSPRSLRRGSCRSANKPTQPSVLCTSRRRFALLPFTIIVVAAASAAVAAFAAHPYNSWGGRGSKAFMFGRTGPKMKAKERPSRRKQGLSNPLFALFGLNRDGAKRRSPAKERNSLHLTESLIDANDASIDAANESGMKQKMGQEEKECTPEPEMSIDSKGEGWEELCFDPNSFDRGLDVVTGSIQDLDVSGAEERCVVHIGEDGKTRREDPPNLTGEEAGEEEDCILVYDVAAVPSYELPPHPIIDEDYREVTNEDMEDEDRHGNGDSHKILGLGNGSDDGSDSESDEADKEQRTLPRCARGIVIMDNFSPFHGQYLTRMALEAYGAGVVSVLSTYVTGYLYQEKGLTDHLTMRMPDEDYIEEWTNAIPFEIVGIICESDSGLEDAERLGEMLGLYPDRHDGINVGRRDKFIMNEICRDYRKIGDDGEEQAEDEGGLRVVRQRMCDSLEEALEFARVLGVLGGAGEEHVASVEAADVDTDALPFDAGSGLSPVGLGSADGSAVEKTIDRGARGSNGIEAPSAEMPPVEDGSATTGSNDNAEPLGAVINRDDLSFDSVDPGLPICIEEEEHDHLVNTGLLGPPSCNSAPVLPCCVVKPSRGVASDDVHLCSSLKSVALAFAKIHGSTMFGSTNGEKHEKVLVQEFAQGTEYAADVVSKAGEHKIAALWKYDKRPANGAAFVYHATELVDADTPVGRAVSEYVMDALDALGVHWGLSHTEVIVDEKGPRLVEVNCRQHNTDFAPLTTACVGYNALDMLLASYLGDATDFPPHTEHMRLDWDSLPDLPVTRSYGAIVHLVCSTSGILREVNKEALEEIEGMESVLAMEVYPRFQVPGERIEPTVDIRTDSGWVHMMNDDPEVFKRDYDRIVELMSVMFDVEKEEEGDWEVQKGGEVVDSSSLQMVTSSFSGSEAQEAEL